MTETTRTTNRQVARLAVYDRAAIHAILAEAVLCHVGFVDGGQPYVIPATFVHLADRPARLADRLCIHGSVDSRMMRCLASGAPACINVTLLDGLVLARSLLRHSMNYRSVVILSRGEEITDPGEKVEVLKALTDHVVPGRWGDARGPTREELARTAVVSFPTDECSAKVRTGPPLDDEPDLALDFWAGVIPLALTPGAPIGDPTLRAGIKPPDYVRDYRRPRLSGRGSSGAAAD